MGVELPRLPDELRAIAEMLKRQGEDIIVLKIMAAADEIERFRREAKSTQDGA